MPGWAGVGVAGGGGHGSGMANDAAALDDLNSNLSLDLTNVLDTYFTLNEHADPPELKTKFYDSSSFINCFKSSSYPLFISLNIQSLMSKHQELCNFLDSIFEQEIRIDVIALQEIWAIPQVSLINIPGFTFVSKTRELTRGGGVGFYVNNEIKF